MKEFKPYVPENTNLPEFTFKAIVLGLLMAVILGAANAYLGLKAGMTIAAAFPAAVIAIAAFRLPFLKGSVLEQNIARTMASVGEALVAGAIFTLPAFLLVNVGGERLWTDFHYWESSIILLIGGVIGVLFVILLRRTLCIDAELPFPEAWACYEIIKTGQKGESGAGYVFGAMGIGVLIEILKNWGGFPIIRECKEFFISFPKSVIHHYNTSKHALSDIQYSGGLTVQSPLASPALMGVGYVIGPKYACINFAGGVLAWLVLIPLVIFVNPQFADQLAVEGVALGHADISYTAWKNLIQPVAVGAMLVGSFYTLWGLRKSLAGAFRGVFCKHKHAEENKSRLDKDLNLKVVFFSAIALVIPMAILYYYFSSSVTGAIVSAIVMLITAFLFAAVGGWIVGLVGNSNQPVSGLTLSTLIIAALVLLLFGVKGLPGIAAVLGVAAVVCCVACMSGDMIQDLKIGRMVGGTPWKMELGELISTIIVAFVLVLPIIILHKGNIAAGGMGIGGAQLPAPQAGLMAQLATGIVGGEMPWGLVVIGMCFSLGLILVKAPAPMLIAVGMYLPFETTFAIFIGGAFKWFSDVMKKRRGEETEGGEGKGILIASGFIAGEAITGVVLAGLVLLGIPSLSEYFFGTSDLAIYKNYGGWLSIGVFALVAYMLIWLPLKKKRA